MTWEDPRGGGFEGAARGARMVAHHEQAKSRNDESQGLRPHGSARRWLVGAGAVLTVTVVVAAVLVSTRGGSEEPGATALPQAAGSVEPAVASASASPVAVTPVVTVADTEPQGRYAVEAVARQTQRDGKRVPPVTQSFRWNFKSGGCGSDTCTGTLVSSSGAKYTYVWDGGTLTMHRPPLVADRDQCVDDAGSAVPLSQASFIATYTYTMAPVTVTVTDGPPEVITGSYEYTVSYENFGNCDNTPEDVVRAAVRYTATRAG